VLTRFILLLFLAITCFAQNNIVVLEREVRGRAEGASSVELLNSTTMAITIRTPVDSDGSFVMRDVNPGSYLVRFIAAPKGPARPTEDLQIAVGEEAHEGQEPAATVSAATLANPPSRKAMKYLEKAQRYSLAGNSAKAIEVLKSAPLDPAGASYIHSRLGTEYLKCGEYLLALPQLEEAARLAPRDSVHHSNLAYVYVALGRRKDAEQAARKAVELDGRNTKAHFLLAAALADDPKTVGEAITHLKIAHRDVPSARFLLAQLLMVTGSRAAADREIESFLDVATGTQREIAQRWLEVHRTKHDQ
jgi:tetratricopeptide (TPR) repeat protein